MERFCELGAEVRFGSPFFVGDHAVEINGEVVTAKSWIIATGSRPIIPSSWQAFGDKIITTDGYSGGKTESP